MYLCAINCLYSSVHVLHASKFLEECILIRLVLFGLRWVTNVGAQDQGLACKLHICVAPTLSFFFETSIYTSIFTLLRCLDPVTKI